MEARLRQLEGGGRLADAAPKTPTQVKNKLRRLFYFLWSRLARHLLAFIFLCRAVGAVTIRLARLPHVLVLYLVLLWGESVLELLVVKI